MRRLWFVPQQILGHGRLWTRALKPHKQDAMRTWIMWAAALLNFWTSAFHVIDFTAVFSRCTAAGWMQTTLILRSNSRLSTYSSEQCRVYASSSLDPFVNLACDGSLWQSYCSDLPILSLTANRSRVLCIFGNEVLVAVSTKLIRSVTPNSKLPATIGLEWLIYWVGRSIGDWAAKIKFWIGFNDEK